jgi:hypothetical protein
MSIEINYKRRYGDCEVGIALQSLTRYTSATNFSADSFATICLKLI